MPKNTTESGTYQQPTQPLREEKSRKRKCPEPVPLTRTQQSITALILFALKDSSKLREAFLREMLKQNGLSLGSTEGPTHSSSSEGDICLALLANEDGFFAISNTRFCSPSGPPFVSKKNMRRYVRVYSLPDSVTSTEEVICEVSEENHDVTFELRKVDDEKAVDHLNSYVRRCCKFVQLFFSHEGSWVCLDVFGESGHVEGKKLVDRLIEHDSSAYKCQGLTMVVNGTFEKLLRKRHASDKGFSSSVRQ